LRLWDQELQWDSASLTHTLGGHLPPPPLLERSLCFQELTTTSDTQARAIFAWATSFRKGVKFQN